MTEDKSGYEIALERIAAVRESMGTDKEIYELDLYRLSLKEIPKEVNTLTNLKTLYLYENQISKIENLDQLANLKTLKLYNNKISKIENLHKLINLTWLNLSLNQINKIENLDKLSFLAEFDLSQNQISKIENLDQLTNLSVLNLVANQISKIENLERLTNLNSLNLSNNQISKIENLDHLSKLLELDLYFNQISKIENLDKLSFLAELDISKNHISKIENLDELTKLLKLHLKSNQISKIENLDKLLNLNELNLGSNQISKIENLDKLLNLNELNLGSNQISKIENLDKLLNLNELNLGSNQISKIENLDKIKNLKNLSLRCNQIKNLENLDELFRLTYLDLWRNQIKKIENLGKCTNLKILELEYNQINKIEKLDQLINVKEINLSGNQIGKIENLKNLTKLELLNLGSNKISKIENLDKLIKLTGLYLFNNQIRKIQNLNQLANLNFLVLSNNKIHKIENLDQLTKLNYLDLTYNKIDDLLESNLNLLSQKNIKFRIRLNDNPFIGKNGVQQEDYPKGHYANHTEQFIKDYYNLKNVIDQNIKQEYIKIPAKIIIYGNSNVGKSFLSHYLKTNTIPVRQESTEILIIDNWKEGDIDAYIYDFGGQDFYHATYQMFFTMDTIYCILWDDKTNHNKVNDELTIDRPDTYFNYNVAYWLANVKYHFDHIKNNSIDLKLDTTEQNSAQIHINLIKNKIDQPSISSSHCHVMEALRDYPVDQSYELMLDSTDDNNYIRKRNFFREELISQISKYQHSISMFSHRRKAIDVILNIRREKGHKPIFIDDLWKQTFEDRHKDENLTDLKSVLRTLHNRGLILWYGKTQLEEKVWLRPDKVIEHVHVVLKSKGIGKFKGNIPKAEFELKFSDLKELMLMQNIAFFDIFSTNYVIPQFLSEQSINDILFKLAQDGLEILFAVQFKDFMPHGLFNRLACFFGGLQGQKYYVKNKMIFTLNSVKVWLEIDPLLMRVIFKAGNTKSKEAAELQMYLFRSLVAAYWSFNPMNFDVYKVYFPNGHNIYRRNGNNPGQFVITLTDNFANPLQTEDVVDTEYERNHIIDFKMNNSQNWEKIEEVYSDIESNFPFGMKVSLDNIYFAEYNELITVFENHKDHNNYVFLHNQLNKDNSRKMYAAPFNPFMNKPLPMTKKIFVSYSRKDVDYKDLLRDYLKFLHTFEIADNWSCEDITIGNWHSQIQRELESSDLIIFMLSHNFFNSKYILEQEVQKTIERIADGGKQEILCVIVRPIVGFDKIKGVISDKISPLQEAILKLGDNQYLPYKKVKKPLSEEHEEKIMPLLTFDPIEEAMTQIVEKIIEKLK